MSSKGLLNAAVGVDLQQDHPSSPFLDKLFVKWFDRLVYPLIWEDPIADMRALGDIEGQNLVCLTSGGCNILSYLSQKPAHIAAVDLNEAHLSLLSLKKSAIQNLSYPSFFQLFAQANNEKNQALVEELLPNLPTFAKLYWQGSTFNARTNWFNHNFYRHGLLGNFIGFGHWIAKRLGYDLSRIMTAQTPTEAAEIFDQEISPLFDHWLIRWLSAQTWVLYGLGIPPRQYEVLKGNETHMADVLRERLRHLACDFDLANNYFAWQAFARRFNTNDQASLPLYLQQSQFETLKNHINNVSLHHNSVTDYLAEQPAKSVDGYVFLDAQDWMNNQQLNELWTEVNRTARKGARVIFRAAGKESPLETMLKPELLVNWHTDSTENEHFWQQDRSAIYGGCFIYTLSV